MRASTVLVGSAIVSSAAAAISACSSEPADPPTVQTNATDDASDASFEGSLDASIADTTDASSTEPVDAAPQIEQVTANFGGLAYTLKAIQVAGVTNGVGTISANEGVESGVAVDLFFDPQVGTTTCAPASSAKVVFTTKTEVYQADHDTGDCSIVVTKFGSVGDALAGTFKANVERSDGTPLFANGKFHVVRKN